MCQCGEGNSLRSDTKTNFYSCIKGLENQKYQWGKAKPSVFMMNEMQF